MRKIMTNILLLSFLFTTACSSLNSAQKHELTEWKGQNLKVEEKNESLAAGLNVLPGIGDFYNGNIGLGVVNLLTWPLSILWAPVGGASGAAEVNYYSTKSQVDQLTKNRQGVINELQSAAMTKQITSDEFYIASQRVNNMNLHDFKNNHSIIEFVPRLGQEFNRLPSSQEK